MGKVSISKAISDGFAIVRERFGSLAALAAVFFVLPGAALGVWFAGFQIAAMTAPETAFEQLRGGWLTFGLAYLVALGVQLTGAGAICAACAGTSAPAFGDSIRIGLRSMPTLIGCMLLAIVAMAGLFLVMALLLGGLAVGAGNTASPGAGLAGVLGILLIIPVVFYLMIKFSLTLPVIVVQGIGSPLGALGQSWRLTKGNSFRLFILYAILGIVYSVVIQIVMQLTLGAIAPGATALPGGGTIAAFTAASVVLGAVVNLVLTAMVVSVHAQLAGPRAADLAGTFD